MIKFLCQRNKILIFLLLSVILGFFSWQHFFVQSLTVTEVVDGDTIKLDDGRTIRYIGLDAPEEGECFNEEAEKINRDLVLGKQVRLETDTNEMDRFGRYLAYVYLREGEEIFVNQELLKQGAGEFFLDTVNLRYQEVLIQAAEEAHKEKRGLWQACAPDPEFGCQIKGNLDRLDKRWYHLPGFRHYETTEVNLEHGDRWFCTEEEAIVAGFEKARE
jgi:micrococcal nuclease